MARYIDADRLKGFLGLDQSGTEDTLKHGTHLHPVRKLELKAYIGAIEYCVNEINKAPSADVVEVKRGEWLRQNGGFFFLCSSCGKACATKGNYCHSCGAKMDGASDKQVTGK